MLYEGGEIDAHPVSLAQMTNSSTTVQLRNAAPLLYSICWQQYDLFMSKFKKEFTRLKRKECDFFFYTTSGSWGMYCRQIRHYWFCIPFLFGFRYTVSWGSDY